MTTYLKGLPNKKDNKNITRRIKIQVMIRTFKNAEYGTIRAAVVNKKPYLCLVDISRTLGIANSQTSRTGIPDSDLKRIEIKEKSKIKVRLFVKIKHLSKFIYKSKKPEIDEINDWLYATILPKLLNSLDYSIDEYEDGEKIIKLIEENKHLKIRNTVLETDMNMLKPKVRYINELLGSKNCVDLDRVSKIIKYPGIGNTNLFKILRTMNILDETNQPYQEFCDKRYFRVVDATVIVAGNVVSSQRTYVYKKGIALIEKILKEYKTKNHER